MTWRPCALALAGALLAACGDDGPESVDAGALSFAVADSASVLDSFDCTLPGAPGPIPAILVVLSDAEDLCSLAGEGREKAGATSLAIVVARANAVRGLDPLAAGDYTVTDVSRGTLPRPDGLGNITVATVTFDRNSATCANMVGSETAARSGTVRLESLTPDRIRGDIDVTLRNGTRVATRFDAPTCERLGNIGLAGAAAVCGGTPAPTACAP